MSRGVCAALVVVAACALAEHGAPAQPDPSAGVGSGVSLCGRELLQARELFCKAAASRNTNRQLALHPYATPAQDSGYGRAAAAAWAPRGWLRAPGGEPAARALLRSRALLAECCYKPCSLEELLDYC